MKGLPVQIINSTAYRMLSTPRVLRRSTQIIIGSFLLLVVILLFVPWQQTAVGSGRVVAFAPGDRVQLITANIEGRIEKWFVRDGDKVKEGELLVRMSDNDPERIERLQRERAAIVRRIRALEMNVELAGSNRKRQKLLSEKEWSSELSVEQAKITEARAQQDLADAEAELARLDSSIARQMMQEIRSPRDGIVQSILAGENSGLIKSGAVLAQLVPGTAERTVELYMKGLDLPFIRVGQQVRLQFEGWPILQFAGLPELSTGTFLGRVRIVDPADDGRGNFRVIVTKDEESIWPDPDLLRQGVRARGWVQMNEVPLWFEIWRFINDFPPFPVPLEGDGNSQSPSPSATETSSLATP